MAETDGKQFAKCAPLLPAVVTAGSDVHAGPDTSTSVIATLKTALPGCASSSTEGFGFRHVLLEGGVSGYVEEPRVSVSFPPAPSGNARVRGSLTGGFGIGHDYLGAQFEIGADHWTGLVALAPFPGLNPSNSFALGARWSRNADGSGFGVAAQALMWRVSSVSSTDDPETQVALALTAHWRWRWSFFLLDVGVGPALSLASYRYSTTDSDVDPSLRGRIQKTTCLGIQLDLGAAASCGFPLDVEIGLGFGF